MRPRPTWAGLLLLFVLAGPGLAARGEVYALVGGRIVPVSGPVIEKGTLVLRDGLVEALGPALAAPADARVIDVQGATLTPGLIDGFGGIGLPSPRPSPAPDPLSPQALALDRIRPADALKARDSGITTALVVPRAGVLPGRSVLINLAGDTAEGMALEQPAALHLQMATLPRSYPGSLMGTMAYARQALHDAAHYRDEWKAYRAAPRGKPRPRFDSALEAWQDVLAGKELLVVTAPRENDIRRALALADEFKLRLAVAGALQAARLADVVKARKLPLLVSVDFDPPRPAPSRGFGGAADEERERREIAEAERNPAALHEAGVSFALVSGHAPDFLAGVRKAIERGLPAEVALRALTLAPAEALGVADRLGSLEPGKIANVVVWSGEPLAKDTRPRMVFVDGELYEPEPKAEKEARP
ncbi:MAG TPA: amidohydrolase family protein [Vicinamibacteria bacterium]|nr:amidohydrolase family protein [Vicinamibacteria bacterium]